LRAFLLRRSAIFCRRHAILAQFSSALKFCGCQVDCVQAWGGVVRIEFWRGRSGWLVAVLAGVSVVSSSAAEAQSLFEMLFGGGGKPKASPSPSPAITRPNLAPKNFRDWSRENQSTSRPDPDESFAERARGPAGSYRTVCVRTCDGYYWPVSHAVSRERFSADAKRCQSSCAGEARLFYQHRGSSDPRELVDLEGKSYTQLKNAFLYRTTLINGCGCRPAPWSAAESYRHHRYAAAEAVKRVDMIARLIENDGELPADAVTIVVAPPQTDSAQLAMWEDPDSPQPEAERSTASHDPGAPIVTLHGDPPASTVTGYIHLHVLPGLEIATADDDHVERMAQAADGGQVSAMKNPPRAKFRRGSRASVQQGTNSRIETLRTATVPTTTGRVRPKRSAAKHIVAQASSPPDAPTFIWPGDTPKRVR
jgi:hypothetical protein